MLTRCTAIGPRRKRTRCRVHLPPTAWRKIRSVLEEQGVWPRLEGRGKRGSLGQHRSRAQADLDYARNPAKPRAQAHQQTTSASSRKLRGASDWIVRILPSPAPATGISYNAGVVKYFFSTLLHPLRDERHFALVEISAIPTKARS
jgi:hypothetical protein